MSARARVAVLGCIFASCVAHASARADAISGPPDEGCPAGTHYEARHGATCVPDGAGPPAAPPTCTPGSTWHAYRDRACTPDDACATDAECGPDRACRAVALCVTPRECVPAGGIPCEAWRGSMEVLEVRGSCGGGATCADTLGAGTTAPCVAARVCMPATVADVAPTAGVQAFRRDGTEVPAAPNAIPPRPVQTVHASQSPPAAGSGGGCGCAHGEAPPAVSLLGLAGSGLASGIALTLARRRRRRGRDES